MGGKLPVDIGKGSQAHVVPKKKKNKERKESIAKA